MTAVDPRSPVVVGVAQASQRVDDLADALEAVALMSEVARAAIDDSRGRAVAAHLDLVVTVKGAWSYRDPSRIVAATIGAANARTALTTDGGNTPQQVVDVLAERISRGELDVALVVGAETIWSRRRMRSAGVEREVAQQADDVVPDETLGRQLQLTDSLESSRGLIQPIDVYPLFESAIRHRRSETHDEHRRRIATLWADFNTVAVANPHAWSRTPMTADEIREPAPDNRMVAFPYTKAMCSNWDLDQAAAVLVCSAEAADRLGVPADRRVFLHGGAEADDTPLVSNRRDLGRSPAIEAAWSTLAKHRQVAPDDIAYYDVYSCFPSAVQAAIEAIGLDESRRLTVTGGLTFAGGPLNNYVSHSIASMVDLLRDDPSALGLVTANGGFLTKHALGIYSATPPTLPFARHAVAEGDIAHDARDAAPEAAGNLTVEACTVMHDRNGPTHALFALLTTDGRRTWGRSDEAGVATAAMTDDLVGTAVHLDDKGVVKL